jgi:hypothetical protein
MNQSQMLLASVPEKKTGQEGLLRGMKHLGKE